MATNPMQKKSRISFILGMLLMLVIAFVVVAFLYMKIQSQDKELEKYKLNSGTVYVLNRDVKSGQILDLSMFTPQNATKTTIPADASGDVMSILNSVKLVDTQGNPINPPNAAAGKNYYYYRFPDREEDVILFRGNDVQVTSLVPGEKLYYYSGAVKNSQKVTIEIAKVDAVVAKIDMKANTILTKNEITAYDEVTTDDLRKEEFNVISLPVDLGPGEYVDIRLRMPTGQDYIVVSKKKVTIPVVNGAYLTDTIQMNLTEEEVLLMSGAIVESFKLTGSELRATRYTEAGLQEAATMTYYPSTEIQTLIKNDPNVVQKAINGIVNNRNEIRKAIDAAVNEHGTDENVDTKVTESITSTQQSRKNYLQSLPVTY